MTDPLESQDAYDPITNVQEWQSRQSKAHGGDPVDETTEENELTRLSTSLLTLFKEVICALTKQTGIPKDVRISLERSCSSLILWSDGYGIAQGRLNHTFNRSRMLRHTILKNLSHIGRVLVDRLVPLVEILSEELQISCWRAVSSLQDASDILDEESSRQSDDSSSDAGSTFSDDDIYEIAEDLKTDTVVLSGLDPLLKSPIFDLSHGRGVKHKASSSWVSEKLFTNKIKHQFPTADASLTLHLGKLSFERYLRGREARRAHDSEDILRLTYPGKRPIFKGFVTANSEPEDSGTGTNQEPRISSKGTKTGYYYEEHSIRIPPLSKEAEDGLPFSCIACGRTVSTTDNSAWKHHLCLDLQPYMCLDMSCPYSSTTFANYETWISHLAIDHEMEPKWDSIKCPLCKEDTGSGKMAVTEHVATHLEGISLLALPAEVDKNMASEKVTNAGDSTLISKKPAKPLLLPHQKDEIASEATLKDMLDHRDVLDEIFRDNTEMHHDFLLLLRQCEDKTMDISLGIRIVTRLVTYNPPILARWNRLLPPRLHIAADGESHHTKPLSSASSSSPHATSLKEKIDQWATIAVSKTGKMPKVWAPTWIPVEYVDKLERHFIDSPQKYTEFIECFQHDHDTESLANVFMAAKEFLDSSPELSQEFHLLFIKEMFRRNERALDQIQRVSYSSPREHKASGTIVVNESRDLSTAGPKSPLLKPDSIASAPGPLVPLGGGDEFSGVLSPSLPPPVLRRVEVNSSNRDTDDEARKRKPSPTPSMSPTSTAFSTPMFELDTPRTTMTGVSPALTESARTEMGQYRKSSTLRAKSSVTSRPDGLWHMDQWWCNCSPRKVAVKRTVFKDSPNKGKQFWTCPQQFSRGACGFFLWDEHASLRKTRVLFPPAEAAEAAEALPGETSGKKVLDKPEPRESKDDNGTQYCYCSRGTYGEMIPCDAYDCRRQYFHLECVGLDAIPKQTTWYCDDCKKRGWGGTDDASSIRDEQAKQGKDIADTND